MEDLSSFLAVSRRLPSVHYHRILSNTATFSMKASKKVNEQDRRHLSFVTIMKVTYPQLCHIILVRSESLYPCHTQGDEIYKVPGKLGVEDQFSPF